MMLPRLVIYFTPACAHCEDAKQVLERVRPYEPFELEEVDITLDRVAFGLHADKVPVVTLNGQVVFRHRVDEDRLIRRLRLARQEMIADAEERRARAGHDRGEKPGR